MSRGRNIFPRDPGSMFTQRVLNVKIKRLTETAIIPEYKSNGAAAVDLHADIDNYIIIEKFGYASSTVKIPTGLAIQIPSGYVGIITARSGLGHEGLALSNSIGIIDSDYRGEILISMCNRKAHSQTIYAGDRIAQMLFMPVKQVQFSEVDKLDSTERGSDGFGSTGNR